MVEGRPVQATVIIIQIHGESHAIQRCHNVFLLPYAHTREPRCARSELHSSDVRLHRRHLRHRGCQVRAQVFFPENDTSFSQIGSEFFTHVRHGFVSDNDLRLGFFYHVLKHLG